MGYVPKDKVFLLDFEDTEYDGLTVRMIGQTVGELLDSIAVSDDTDYEALKSAASAGDMAAVRAGLGALHDRTVGMYETFCNHLISWNVETQDGRPVPTTLDGVKSQDTMFIRDIMAAWRKGTTSVSQNLGTPSNDGDSGKMPLGIPMEISPESPAS